MNLTIGQVVERIESMRAIVRIIESGGSVSNCLNEIEDYLGEYIEVLTNTKVKI